MKTESLITVIVPIYNVKDYLEECLKSIREQTYKNLEIILVDDGSTDGSSDICDKFGKMDGRARVIRQKNTGAAAARKNAVLCAEGSYVCFVDADDKIESNMIENLAENIGECDMITSGCYYEDKTGKCIELADAMAEGIYDTERSMDYLISNMLAFQNRFEYGILPYLVNKMFKAEVLKEVIADIDPVLSYAEDVELLYQYILRCKAVRITHRCLYFYRYRGNSASRLENKNYMSDLNKVYLALEKAFLCHPLKNILIHQLRLFVIERIYSIADWMRFSPDTQMIKYIFPFNDLGKESKVVLYGAGRVGMDYYRYISRRKPVQMVSWVDSRWMECRNNYTPVDDPKNMEKDEYDYVIIAVKERELADEIRRDLIGSGIAGHKILWRMPEAAMI